MPASNEDVFESNHEDMFASNDEAQLKFFAESFRQAREKAAQQLKELHEEVPEEVKEVPRLSAAQVIQVMSNIIPVAYSAIRNKLNE